MTDDQPSKVGQQDLNKLVQELQDMSSVSLDNEGIEIASLVQQIDCADRLLDLVDSKSDDLLKTIDKVLQDIIQ